jgi:hypothetical protein
MTFFLWCYEAANDTRESITACGGGMAFPTRKDDWRPETNKEIDIGFFLCVRDALIVWMDASIHHAEDACNAIHFAFPLFRARPAIGLVFGNYGQRGL